MLKEKKFPGLAFLKFKRRFSLFQVKLSLKPLSAQSVGRLCSQAGRAPLEAHPKSNLRPAKAGLSLTGFTLIELLIVVIIIGVLSVLGLASFTGPKEQVLDREAQANLKLIAAAEKIYRMEIGGFVNCSDTNEVNDRLVLMIPGNNWQYKVRDSSASVFSALANRASGPYANKVFCINQTLENPTNVSCVW